MPEHPTQVGDSWRFSFPRYEGPFPCQELCPSVGYITTRALGPLKGQSITMTIEITGPGIFENRLEPENICWRVATVRLLIQRQGDDSTEDSYRWWSNPDAIVLKEGEHKLTVPLTPDRWSNVSGEKGSIASEEFYAALENVENIGLTFGGGCFFGHGVNVSAGPATFILRKFMISR